MGRRLNSRYTFLSEIIEFPCVSLRKVDTNRGVALVKIDITLLSSQDKTGVKFIDINHNNTKSGINLNSSMKIAAQEDVDNNASMERMRRLALC